MTQMAKAKTATTNGNIYEEARKLRVEENKKRVEDLGILKLAKKLSDSANSEKKSKAQQRHPKLKPENSESFEPRRSSRARNPISFYHEDIDMVIPSMRKRSRWNSSSWYAARPFYTIKIATYEEEQCAKKAAEEFQSSLQSGNPSFVKQMLQSHVYRGFWLSLPALFCQNHLPKVDSEVILEDENGSESDSKYLGKKAGLSAGWRGFALAHKLNAGDALVFELVEPGKFKIYTFRASASHPIEECIDTLDREGSAGLDKGSKRGKKLHLKSVDEQKEKVIDTVDIEGYAGLKNGSKRGKKLHLNSVDPQNEKGTQIQKEAKKANVNKDGGLTNIQKPKRQEGTVIGGTLHEEEHDKEDKPADSEKPKFEANDQCVVKPRKKRAERLFRKRVGV